MLSLPEAIGSHQMRDVMHVPIREGAGGSPQARGGR